MISFSRVGVVPLPWIVAKGYAAFMSVTHAGTSPPELAHMVQVVDMGFCQ